MQRALRLGVIVALVAGALVAVSAQQARAAGVACQATYSSGTINLPINDMSTTASWIDVPENGLVAADVDVAVNVHHSFTHDLGIGLTSVSAADVFRHGTTLFNQEIPEQTEADMLGTIFDDEATIEIARGDAPYTGRFRPTRDLARFDGDTGGKYMLTVSDRAVDDTGTLNDWSLTFRYQSCDFDSDGVEDHADSCLQIAAHTATGCPVTTRALTAKYANGKFRGTVSSPAFGCKAGRAVTVWRVHSGPDHKVGTTTTRADGRYALKRAGGPGRYYATSARTAVADVAECPAVRSKRVRIS